jgi:hypothetical protein
VTARALKLNRFRKIFLNRSASSRATPCRCKGVRRVAIHYSGFGRVAGFFAAAAFRRFARSLSTLFAKLFSFFCERVIISLPVSNAVQLLFSHREPRQHLHGLMER